MDIIQHKSGEGEIINKKQGSQNKEPYSDQINADNYPNLPKKRLVAIPCYNEEKTIGSVVVLAKKYADEVLVVDDGSTDKTAEIAEHSGASVMRHGGNKGYGSAIQSCFQYAKEMDYDVLTILDGDGQHDADQLETVMNPVIENNIDICIGSRFLDDNKENVPLYRRFGIKVLTKLTNSGSKNQNHRVTDAQSGFRAYSRNAINKIIPKDANMGVSAEILLQGRKRNLLFAEVPIDVSYDGDTSTQGPVGHGLGVIISIIKYLEVEHSLLFFGVPGIILFGIGFFFGFQEYLHYEQFAYLRLVYILISLTGMVLGAISGMTGLILHAVVNASRRR